MKRKGETNLKAFREGIFALRTRRFGSVAEIMIQALYGLQDSNNLRFDKLATNGKRIEIKFATVMKANEATIRPTNVIQQCLSANLSNRAMKYSDIANYHFDCNIQQIKRTCFDILYYGLFFADKILIFKMNSTQILHCEGYSDKQHRNSTAEGQFHITNDNIQYHQKKYLVQVLTYEELLALFEHL